MSPLAEVHHLREVREEADSGAASSPHVAPVPGSRVDEPKKASWALQPGDEIAPGRIAMRRLGGGTAYEVYLVWDEELFALAVAKLLRPDRVDHARTLRSLRREARTLERLAHPVIVRSFDAVVDGPRPHLLLEHLEGPTLQSLLRKSGGRVLPLEQLLPLALHVAAALHYLATKSIVHLDVKPSNIVMGVPPRLIDLSIARSIERANELTDPVGTTAYMAPEQCEPGARGEIGPPADVWGLGATLFHAVYGKVPFRREFAEREGQRIELYSQLTAEPRPLPRNVPAELAELVLSCLRKDPAERPTAAELALALQPFVDALPKRLRVTRRGIRMV